MECKVKQISLIQRQHEVCHANIRKQDAVPFLHQEQIACKPGASCKTSTRQSIRLTLFLFMAHADSIIH